MSASCWDRAIRMVIGTKGEYPSEFAAIAAVAERVIAQAGIVGVTRQRRVHTTIADPAAVRPGDLVDRDFTAFRPDRLLVADFVRHEALSNRAEVKDHPGQTVAAAR